MERDDEEQSWLASIEGVCKSISTNLMYLAVYLIYLEAGVVSLGGLTMACRREEAKIIKRCLDF